MSILFFFIDYFNRLKIPKKKEIIEYYPKYLLAHKNPLNKILHIFGNLITLLYIFTIIYFSFQNILFIFLLIISPFVVYIGAWPGHFFFEKNKPATFKMNPILTKICDWIMIYQLLTRKLKFDTRIK